MCTGGAGGKEACAISEVYPTAFVSITRSIFVLVRLHRAGECALVGKTTNCFFLGGWGEDAFVLPIQTGLKS